MRKFLVIMLATAMFSLASCYRNAEQQQATENEEVIEETIDTVVETETDTVVELDSVVLEENAVE